MHPLSARIPHGSPYLPQHTHLLGAEYFSAPLLFAPTDIPSASEHPGNLFSGLVPYELDNGINQCLFLLLCGQTGVFCPCPKYGLAAFFAFHL